MVSLTLATGLKPLFRPNSANAEQILGSFPSRAVCLVKYSEMKNREPGDTGPGNGLREIKRCFFGNSGVTFATALLARWPMTQTSGARFKADTR